MSFFTVSKIVSQLFAHIFEYGEGPESSKGGLILLHLIQTSIWSFKFNPTLNIDVLNGPYRHGSYYSVIQLRNFDLVSLIAPLRITFSVNSLRYG